MTPWGPPGALGWPWGGPGALGPRAAGDEVRNFFVDGQWRYSVFTHGTDESDAGYYQEPDGPRKEACKALAERVYNQRIRPLRAIPQRHRGPY